MAGDQNKSNRGMPNKLGNSSSWIDRQGQAFSQQTAQERLERQRVDLARERIGAYQAAINAGVPQEFAEDMQAQIGSEMKMMNTLLPRAELRAETRRERFTNLAISGINRNFASSSVNGQVRDYARSSTGQTSAMSYMNSSYSDLERQSSATMNQIGDLGRGSASLAERLYNADGSQNGKIAWRIADKERQRQELERNLGGMQGAMTIQRSMGLDPVSQNRDLFGTGQKAAGMLASGQLDSNAGAKRAAEGLTAALEALKNTVGKTDEEIEKLRGEAKEAADAFNGAGGGGRGGMSTAEKWQAGLGAAAQGFAIAGSTMREMGVNQPMARVNNIAGFAAIENEKYQTYKSAAGGDVASQLALQRFGSAEAFGANRGFWANRALEGDIAGGVAQGAAGAAQIAGTLNPVSDVLNTGESIKSGIEGGLNVAQGAASVAISSKDRLQNISYSQARNAGVQTYMNAARSLNAVNAEQLQGFRNFAVDSNVAAMSMGGSGAGFVSRMVDNSMLDRMAQARISPEQMTKAAQIGAQQMGSTFNENQIFAARGLERSGFGSTTDNMSRMATLAGAGANNPQAGLGSVLEAAFGKSLESSKALNMMVENTATMVQQGTGRAMGIDTTGASASILAAGINANDPNKEFATARAATAADIMKNIGTDTGVNFAAMNATARISKMTGMSGTEAIVAQGLDDATLRSLKGMKPNEINAKLLDRGINVKEGQEQATVDNLIKARLITNLQAGGAGIATGIDASRLASDMMSGKKLSDFTRGQQAVIGQGATLAGFSGASEFLRSATAINSPEPNKGTTAKVAGALAGEGGSDQQKTLDDMRTQGFKQLSQAAREATVDFKSAGDALKALGVLAKGVEEFGDKGGEGKAKVAASEAAGSFSKSTLKFETSVEQFSKAVNGIMNKSGMDKFEPPVDSKSAKRGASPGN